MYALFQQIQGLFFILFGIFTGCVSVILTSLGFAIRSGEQRVNSVVNKLTDRYGRPIEIKTMPPTAIATKKFVGNPNWNGFKGETLAAAWVHDPKGEYPAEKLKNA